MRFAPQARPPARSANLRHCNGLEARLAAACLLVAALAPAPLPARAQAAPLLMQNFMVMSLCLDAGGAVLPQSPTSSACAATRKIRPGEIPPYLLNNFSSNADRCATRAGVLARDNLPITIGSVTRIASFDLHYRKTACQTDSVSADGSASVQYFDGAYGFIMGSWSPAAYSSMDSKSLCATEQHSSMRFSRGWVIAPAALPAVGMAGYTAIKASISAGPVAQIYQSCPAGGQTGFSSWVVNPVTFTSNLTLLTVVSDHYSAADSTGQSPGTAEQMERTYWTQEFGLSRWEKWARDDWSYNGQTAAAMAYQLSLSAQCNAPPSLPASVSPGMAAGQVGLTSGYSQVLRDPRDGTQHSWYLIRCQDYTNIQPQLAQANSFTIGDAQQGYWQP